MCYKIYRMCGPACEDDFGLALGIQELSHGLSGVLVLLCGIGSYFMHCTVQIRAAGGTEFIPSVQYAARTQRSGRIIQIDKRLAVHPHPQLRKTTSEFFYGHNHSSLQTAKILNLFGYALLSDSKKPVVYRQLLGDEDRLSCLSAKISTAILEKNREDY